MELGASTTMSPAGSSIIIFFDPGFVRLGIRNRSFDVTRSGYIVYYCWQIVANNCAFTTEVHFMLELEIWASDGGDLLRPKRSVFLAFLGLS